MAGLTSIKEWRSVEVAKLFLLKLDLKLKIEDSPTDFFDFIVSLEEDPHIRFAIEVKSRQNFKSKVNKQIDSLTKYRDQRLITIPVLLLKIDDVKEKGELDFLIFPSFKEERLLVRYTFKFSKLNKDSFSKKLQTIKKWYVKLPYFLSNEKEQLKRTITEDDLENLANTEIEKSFKGLAIVGQIEVVGLKDDILGRENINLESLNTFFKLRKFLDFAITKAQTVQMFDYDSTTLIEEVEYPSIIQNSNSFIFILPVDGSSNQRILASIFSIIATILEIWRLSLNNKYTIRGAVNLGDIFFNKSNSVIFGESIEELSKLTKHSENRYRVIISSKIKALIRQNLNDVNPAMIDYFKRFIFKDEDDLLAINPALILANSNDAAQHSMELIKEILNRVEDETEITKFDILLEKVKNQDLDLQDESIFL